MHYYSTLSPDGAAQCPPLSPPTNAALPSISKMHSHPRAYMVNTYSLYACWGSVFMYNTCIHAEFTVFSLYLYSLYSYWAAYSCIIHVFKVPYPCIHHVGWWDGRLQDWALHGVSMQLHEQPPAADGYEKTSLNMV